MSKKLNAEYAKSQEAGIKKLNDGATFDKGTAHVTFRPEDVVLPENVTEESIRAHRDLFNNLAGQVEVGTSEFARNAHKENKEIERIDGSLDLFGVHFHTEHDLRQTVGDDSLFGMSTTAVRYDYSADQTAWVEERRDTISRLAKELFD